MELIALKTKKGKNIKRRIAEKTKRIDKIKMCKIFYRLNKVRIEFSIIKS